MPAPTEAEAEAGPEYEAEAGPESVPAADTPVPAPTEAEAEAGPEADAEAGPESVAVVDAPLSAPTEAEAAPAGEVAGPEYAPAEAQLDAESLHPVGMVAVACPPKLPTGAIDDEAAGVSSPIIITRLDSGLGSPAATHARTRPPSLTSTSLAGAGTSALSMALTCCIVDFVLCAGSQRATRQLVLALPPIPRSKSRFKRK